MVMGETHLAPKINNAFVRDEYRAITNTITDARRKWSDESTLNVSPFFYPSSLDCRSSHILHFGWRPHYIWKFVGENDLNWEFIGFGMMQMGDDGFTLSLSFSARTANNANAKIENVDIDISPRPEQRTHELYANTHTHTHACLYVCARSIFRISKRTRVNKKH